MKNVCIALLLLTVSFGFSQDTKDDVKTKFLEMLDGTKPTAKKAIATFTTEKVIKNGMLPNGKNPSIYSSDENCVWFTLTDEDGDKNAYYICSEGNKIIEFELDFDWEEEEE